MPLVISKFIEVIKYVNDNLEKWFWGPRKRLVNTHFTDTIGTKRQQIISSIILKLSMLQLLV